MHRSNLRMKIMNPAMVFAFTLSVLAFSVSAQPSSAPSSDPKVIIRMEPMPPEKEEPPTIDPALGEGRAGRVDQQRASGQLAERHGQVGREEGFAITRVGAANGECQLARQGLVEDGVQQLRSHVSEELCRGVERVCGHHQL